MAPGTTFVVTVTDAVTDLAGNALDGDGNGAAAGSFVSRFSTGNPTGTTGVLTVVESFFPGENLQVELTDTDLNVTSAADMATVILLTSSGENEPLELLETGPASGIFIGSISTSFRDTTPGFDDDGTLTVQASETVTVIYNDQLTALGTPDSITAVVSVVGGVDGTVSVINVPGNAVEVTVEDADVVANPTTGTDVLGCGATNPCVRISSPSTGDGEDMPLLLESTEGSFSAVVALAVSATAVPGNGILEIAGAATVEVSYIDGLRANGDNRGVSVLASTNISLHHVVIRDQPNGRGSAVEAMTISADDSVVFYAAGYDDQGGYLGDQSVDWSVAGGIGIPTPIGGMSTTFTAITVGFGTVTATHPDSSVGPDSTGLIEVVAGGLAYVLIRDASDGVGNEVGGMTLRTDDTRTLYSAGYDADDNFVGNTVVTWSVTGSIGKVSPAIGSSTQFNPTTIGTGRIWGTHASTWVSVDHTGDVVVSGGNLAAVVIYDAPGGPTGGGAQVGDLSITTDDDVSFFAAGFDADGNYLGDQSVTWRVVGGIGEVSPNIGSSTTFNPTDLGPGQVIADHASARDASTGVLQVAGGALDHIIVRDAPSGGGSPVGPASINTDTSFQVFAAGYDADDNFVGAQSVTWSVVGGIGAIVAGPSTNSVFNATTVGSGTIDADDGPPTDLISYPSGTLTVSVGALAEIRIEDDNDCAGTEIGNETLAADQTLTVYAVGYDADGNCRGDETVAWAVNGGIGGMTPASGSSSVFNPKLAAVGSITATHATVASDDTGALTITVGALAAITIRTRPGGVGVAVGNVSITVDDTLTLYSAGYDSDGNYHSDPSVNWQSLAAVGTVLPATGSSTLFTPGGSGAETIRAIHGASSAQDDTGTITVTTSIANLAHVLILDQPGCSGNDAVGSVVDAESLTTDDTLTLFAVGFDSFNQCLDDVAVTWVLNGAGGVLDPGPNASTSFDPQVAGQSPTITADHSNAAVTDHTTGLISIDVGALDYITVRDASNNGGNVVGNLSITTDDELTFHAAGYDADHNYIIDQSVEWFVSGGIGTVTPSGSSTTFNPSNSGLGQVLADHPGPGVSDDSTGIINVSAGGIDTIRIVDAPGGAGTDVGEVPSLTADHTLTVYAAGYDSDGNFVSDEDVTWSVTGGIGVVLAGPSSSAVFDATTVGTGTINAAQGPHNDSTGTITVVAGVLARVSIVDAALGVGTAVGNLTVSTDADLSLWAAGFDADGNYIADQSVAWSVSGGIGVVSPAMGTGTTFDATAMGAGSVLADFSGAGVTDDSTGTLTIVGGGLAAVVIRDAPSGGGSEVGDLSITADDQRTMYAAGYDADHNYLGDQSVTWSVTNSIGVFAPNPAPSTIFYADVVGVGVINANHSAAGVTDDATGNINVSVGVLDAITIRDAAAGAGNPVGNLSRDTDDSDVLFAAGYDDDGNFINDVSVSWHVSSVGAASPLTGASTTIDYTTVGTGSVTANHASPSVTDDSTGTITVGLGTLAYVLVRNGANGTGLEVGDVTLAVDDTATFYAAGYDADGNYIADQTVAWNLNVSTGPFSGTIVPASGFSTTLEPDAEGDGTLTANHATAVDDTTGTITVVATTAPVVTGASPSSGDRNRTGVLVIIDGGNFDCVGAGPAVTFLPASDVTVNSVDACSATQLTIDISIPCNATVGNYDILVANPDARWGIGSSLFSVATAVEGPYGDATCSDGRDNDCDSLTDSAADPGCAPPGEIQVSCATPTAYAAPSVCTVDLDGTAGQAGYLSCTATPDLTVLFEDTFDDFSQWPTISAGTPQIDCTTLPSGCAASAMLANWSVERTLDTTGMDRVCLDFRIAHSGANNGESITIQFDAGSGWTTAFFVNFDTWDNDGILHDNPTTAGVADWYGPVCLTDIDASAGDNPGLDIRLSATAGWADYVFIDDMVATGVPGTKSNVFCEDGATLGDWTLDADGGDLNVFNLGGNSVIRHRDSTGASAMRCFSTVGLDVVDMEFDFGQENEAVSKYVHLLLSTTGSAGTFSEHVTLWLTNGANDVGAWRQNRVLLDHFKLLRLTNFDPAVADNTDVCIRFDLEDASSDDTYLDNICVDGMTFPDDLFTIGSFTDVGGGSYDFTLSSKRPVTSNVTCAWVRDAMTLSTDCAGSNSCPANTVFVP